MQKISYDDASYPIRRDFSESHSRYSERLQSPGTWFTGAERIDIAKEVRHARTCALCQKRKAALAPRAVDGDHSTTTTLPPAAIEAIHSISNDAARLTRRWYESLLADGLTEGEYIEIIGTVVAIVSIDSFAIAIGVTERTLPAPGPGEPSGYRPDAARKSNDAWVPMIPPENAGTPEADLWKSGRTGNVIRAMSLVPDEVRTLRDLSEAHYLPMEIVPQAGVDAGRALNRSQMELVAGRVSALNECHY